MRNTQKSNPAGADNRREARIFVRVSPGEKRKFMKLARRQHTDVSELARKLLHREADVKTLEAGA